MIAQKLRSMAALLSLSTLVMKSSCSGCAFSGAAGRELLETTTAAILPTMKADSAAQTARLKSVFKSGLAYDFYEATCPELEDKVRAFVQDRTAEEDNIPAQLVRLAFHDCASAGCDASILLNGPGGERETDAVPQNKKIEGADEMDDLKSKLSPQCQAVVSCADLIVLAGREGVYQSGGPFIPVPLGRRDRLTPATREAIKTLPEGSQKILGHRGALRNLTAMGLDLLDLIALSGVHTFGNAHCFSFLDRLKNNDTTIDPEFAKSLLDGCIKAEDEEVQMDPVTPLKFDKQYYVNLINHKGLFTSDQDLWPNPVTAPIVALFAISEEAFFVEFATSYRRMAAVGVLTGDDGEIRKVCSMTNAQFEALKTAAM